MTAAGARVIAAIRDQILLPLGLAALSLHPLAWLGGMQAGALHARLPWLALALLTVLSWSWLSEQQPGSDANHRYAFLVLALSALLAALGRIPLGRRATHLGAPLEAYALETIAGARRRPLSRLGTSALSALAWPLERVVQRLLGMVLQ